MRTFDRSLVVKYSLLLNYRRRVRLRKQRRAKRVFCGIVPNGFIEIDRALGDELSITLPRESKLAKSTHLANGVDGAVTTACTVDVTFKVPYRVELGENLAICGGCRELGNWKIIKALELDWNPGHVWTGRVPLPSGRYEFKCVRISGDGANNQWEYGLNRVMHVPVVDSNRSEMEATLEFGQTGISSFSTIIRETIVVNQNGEELFRMKGDNHYFTPNPVSEVPSHPIEDGTRTGDFLRTELQLDADEILTVNKRYPNLRFMSVDTDLKPWLEFLLREIGMSRSEVASLLLKRPSAVEISPHSSNLKSLVDYFVRDLGVPADRFFRLLIRNPTLLNRSMADIKPKADVLKRVTDLDNKGVGKVLMGCSGLLSKRETEIKRRVEHVISQFDVSRYRCSNMLLRHPPLLSMKPETLSTKVSYYTKSLKRNMDELVTTPACLCFSLENRVVRRFEYLNQIHFPHFRYKLISLLRPPDQRFQKFVKREMTKIESGLTVIN